MVYQWIFLGYSWKVDGTVPTYWFLKDPLVNYLLKKVSVPSILTLRYLYVLDIYIYIRYTLED